MHFMLQMEEDSFSGQAEEQLSQATLVEQQKMTQDQVCTMFHTPHAALHSLSDMLHIEHLYMHVEHLYTRKKQLLKNTRWGIQRFCLVL